MPHTPTTISQETRNLLRTARGRVLSLQKEDGNESETRRRVDFILESFCGYCPFEHFHREYRVDGIGSTEFADIVVKINPDKIALVVELKRVNVDLNEKHLGQVARYSVALGCEWVLLTNGREWELHHISRETPVRAHRVGAWNVMEDDVEKIVEGFGMISLRSVRGGDLGRLWRKWRMLLPETVTEALFSKGVVQAMRAALRVGGKGPLLSEEEVKEAVRRQLGRDATRTLEEKRVGGVTPQKAVSGTSTAVSVVDLARRKEIEEKRSFSIFCFVFPDGRRYFGATCADPKIRISSIRRETRGDLGKLRPVHHAFIAQGVPDLEVVRVGLGYEEAVEALGKCVAEYRTNQEVHGDKYGFNLGRESVQRPTVSVLKGG